MSETDSVTKRRAFAIVWAVKTPHDRTPMRAVSGPLARAQVVVIGNGGHARSCVDAWPDDSPLRPAGCTGPDPSEHGELEHLGTDDDLAALYGSGLRHAFIALGAPRLRAALTERATDLGFTLVTLVASSAQIGRTAEVGPGTAVLRSAVIGAYARVGAGCIVNTGATIDHDCVLGDFSHVAPGAHLAGSVRIGAHALVGVGACIRPGITVGNGAVVGAGAVVVHDVPAGATVAGNPAHRIAGKAHA